MMTSFGVRAAVATAVAGLVGFGGTFGYRSATTANPRPVTPSDFTAAQHGNPSGPLAVNLDWDDEPGASFQLSRDGVVIYTGNSSNYTDLGTGWNEPTAHYTLVAVVDGRQSAQVSADVEVSNGWGAANEIAAAFPSIIGPSMSASVWRGTTWSIAQLGIDSRIRVSVKAPSVDGDNTSIAIVQFDDASGAQELFHFRAENGSTSTSRLGQLTFIENGSGFLVATVLFNDSALSNFVLLVSDPDSDITAMNQFINDLPL